MLLLRRPAASLVMIAAGVGLVGAGLGPTMPAAAEVGSISVPPTKAWILVDGDSGRVLAGQSHHEALPPASTQKLMTALVAVEQLPRDATFTVGEGAAAQPAMRIGMQAGQNWPLSPALHSLLMVSANDVAYALAEAASGTLADFAAEMNATAKRYGMTDSTFNDPAGFDDSASFNGGSLASAYDLAIAARNTLAVPLLAEIAATTGYRFAGPAREHTLTNHNKLLRRYPGAIGMKTGFTRRAGHTFVGAAKRDGRTMIAVVLDSDNIYKATSTLLDRGFATPADDPGTGEQLPAARVKPYMPEPELAAMLLGVPAARVAAIEALQPEVAAAAGPATPSQDAGPSVSSGGSGWLDRLAVAVSAVLAVVVALRWRARRRLRARALRRRRLAEARRSETARLVDPDGWDAGCRVQMVREFESI